MSDEISLHESHRQILTTNLWYAVPVAGFLISEIVNSAILKQRMSMPLCGLFQLLDENALRTDLFRSLLLLHGQPPLFNLLAGIILKLAGMLGCTPETLGSLLFGVLGLATAVLLFHILISWTNSRVLASVAVALYFMNPSYYGGSLAGTGRSYFFYEFPLQSILLVFCLSVALWLKRGTYRTGLAFVMAVAIVVNTRTLFHPLFWGVVVIAAGLAPQFRRHTKTVLLLGMIGLFLVFVWTVKNYALFGVLTTSSWDGLNLDRGFAPLPKPLGDIDVSQPWPDATQLLSSFPRINTWPQESLRVVTAGAKVCGGTNWNNLYMVTTRNEAIARALKARRDMVRYVRHIVLMYKLTTRPMYLHPYLAQAFNTSSNQFSGYLWLYDRILFLPLSERSRASSTPNEPHWTLFNVFVVPGLFIGTLFMICCSRQDRIRLAVIAYTAFFPIISASLSDGFEGNRMRHSTYPLMILLGMVLIGFGYRALRAHLHVRRPSGARPHGNAEARSAMVPQKIVRVRSGIVPWIALSLLLAVALRVRIGETWAQERLFGSKRELDPLTQLEYRVSTFDRRVPPTAVLGYRNDRPPADGLAQLEHFQLQYAMAPRTLDEVRPGQKWLIVWIHDPAEVGRLYSDQTLKVVHDAGSGLFLLESVK